MCQSYNLLYLNHIWQWLLYHILAIYCFNEINRQQYYESVFPDDVSRQQYTNVNYSTLWQYGGGAFLILSRRKERFKYQNVCQGVFVVCKRNATLFFMLVIIFYTRARLRMQTKCLMWRTRCEKCRSCICATISTTPTSGIHCLKTCPSVSKRTSRKCRHRFVSFMLRI